jgi:hypothetical protein
MQQIKHRAFQKTVSQARNSIRAPPWRTTKFRVQTIKGFHVPINKNLITFEAETYTKCYSVPNPSVHKTDSRTLKNCTFHHCMVWETKSHCSVMSRLWWYCSTTHLFGLSLAFTQQWSNYRSFTAHISNIYKTKPLQVPVLFHVCPTLQFLPVLHTPKTGNVHYLHQLR